LPCLLTASTYALTLFRHNYKEDGKEYAIDFWDTAGQEQFNKLHGSYYYQANCCILCFDITRKVTYKNLEMWYKEMRAHCPDIPVICVANKVDVDPAMAKKKFNFPQTQKLPFFCVSAADGTNVVRVFKEAVKLAIKNKEEPQDEVMDEIWRLLREDDNDVDTGSGKAAPDCYEDDGLREAVAGGLAAALGPNGFVASPQMTAVAA